MYDTKALETEVSQLKPRREHVFTVHLLTEVLFCFRALYPVSYKHETHFTNPFASL